MRSAATPAHQGEEVLDLACGTGMVTMGAAAAVGMSGKVLGVDISEGMLERVSMMILPSSH